jgi:hypothetical protein
MYLNVNRVPIIYLLLKDDFILYHKLFKTHQHNRPNSSKLLMKRYKFLIFLNIQLHYKLYFAIPKPTLKTKIKKSFNRFPLRVLYSPRKRYSIKNFTKFEKWINFLKNPHILFHQPNLLILNIVYEFQNPYHSDDDKNG